MVCRCHDVIGKCARKDYLAFVKSKKHSVEKIRKVLRKHLVTLQVWYGLLNHKIGRNTVNFYGIICICGESVQDLEADTLCFLHLFRFRYDWGRYRVESCKYLLN